MSFGAHSAANMGVVADFGPMPKPRKKRAMNMCHQVFVKACQKQARKEMPQEMKTVPRRPKTLFMGSVIPGELSVSKEYKGMVWESEAYSNRSRRSRGKVLSSGEQGATYHDRTRRRCRTASCRKSGSR